MKHRKQEGIAAAVRSGRPGAIEELVRTYQDELFSFVSGLLRDPFEAQEVVQDTFLSAHRALTTRYDDERCRRLSLRPWLYRIARNLAFNRLRSKRANREAPLDPELLPSVEGTTGRAGATGALETAESLDRAMARLGVQDRELLLLRFVDELPYADLAAVIGASEAAARGKVFRAAGRLRLALKEMEDHS